MKRLNGERFLKIPIRAGCKRCWDECKQLTKEKNYKGSANVFNCLQFGYLKRENDAQLPNRHNDCFKYEWKDESQKQKQRLAKIKRIKKKADKLKKEFEALEKEADEI